MKKIILKLSFLILITFEGLISKSQTTTINYLTSGLSTTSCNVFNPSVNIGSPTSVSHFSLAGGVTFTSANGISLATYPQSNAGTAYDILFNFLPNYKYSISITTSGGDGYVYLNTSVVPNLTSFPTSSNTSCTPDASVSGYSTVGYGQLHTAIGSGTATSTVPQFTVSGSTQPYLVVWASGGLSSNSLSGFSISNITIVATPPPTFTINPTASFTCGTAPAQTFTITNVYNSPGVTSWQFNLGSASNGWLYNGSAAPQIIPSTTNSISLTPTACGVLPNNVSGTAYIGSTGYSAGTSTVSITPPAFAISGPAGICTTPVSYSLGTLPCSATATWSATPAGLISVSPTVGPSTTVTRVANGTVTLTATINNVCGANGVTVTKPIVINSSAPTVTGTYTNAYNGSTNPLGIYPSVVNSACTGYYITTNMSIANATSTTWSKISSSNVVGWSQPDPNDISFYLFTAGETAVFQVSAQNACGTTSYQYEWQASNCGSGGGGCNTAAFLVSPNPATNAVIITPNVTGPCNSVATPVGTAKAAVTGSVVKSNANTPVLPFTALKVYTSVGKLVKAYSYPQGITQTKIDVGSLPAGIYYLELSGTKLKQTEKIIIQH